MNLESKEFIKVLDSSQEGCEETGNNNCQPTNVVDGSLTTKVVIGGKLWMYELGHSMRIKRLILHLSNVLKDTKQKLTVSNLVV